MFFFSKFEHDPYPCSEVYGKMIEGSFNGFGDNKYFSLFFFNLHKNPIF